MTFGSVTESSSVKIFTSEGFRWSHWGVDYYPSWWSHRSISHIYTRIFIAWCIYSWIEVHDLLHDVPQLTNIWEFTSYIIQVCVIPYLYFTSMNNCAAGVYWTTCLVVAFGVVSKHFGMSQNSHVLLPIV